MLDDTSVARTQQALLRAYEADKKAYDALEELQASENPDPEAISAAEQVADDAHWAAQQAEYTVRLCAIQFSLQRGVFILPDSSSPQFPEKQRWVAIFHDTLE